MASGSAGSIYVDLLLRDSGFQQGLRKAGSNSRSALGGISADADKARVALAGVINPISSITSALGALGISVAGALSVQQIVQYSDTWKQLQGRLSIVESDMLAVGRAQEALFEIAQRNRTPLADVINFYQRLNQFVPEATRSQYDLLGVTESVTAALAVTGENSISAQAALVQFSQGIGTNFEAAGQELRSIQEQAPRLAQALMNALGDGSKSLQQLVKDGSLTRDSVLRALGGLGEEGRKLAAELAKVPVTVSQAFTQLDNAFLKFIGQSKLVTEGTSSLAAGIKLLADNLDLVTDSVSTLAILFAARYIPTLITLTAAQISAAATFVSFNLLLGQAAFGSKAAAASLLTLRGAFAALQAVLPIAALAAITYALYELIDGNDSAVAAEKRYAEALEGTRKLQLEYISATKQRRDEIKTTTKQNITAHLAELKSLQTLLSAYKDRSSISLGAEELLGRARNDIFNPLSGGLISKRQLPSDVAAQAEGLLKNVKELQSVLDQLDKVDSGGGGVPGNGKKGKKDKEDKEAVKKLKQELDDQARSYENVRELVDGLDDATRQYLTDQQALEEALARGVISFQQYENGVVKITKQFEEAKNKANDAFFDIEAISKKASENAQDAFANFLFDPFADGLKGMVRNFADAMRRIIAEATSKSILGSIFGSSSSGGGIFSGLAGFFGGSSGASTSGNLLAGLDLDFAAAKGGSFGPGKWGIVGEEGPELLYTGQSGATIIPNDGFGGKGNVYNIDARGADQGAVTRIEALLLGLAGPGVIEQRVINSQKRGGL